MTQRYLSKLDIEIIKKDANAIKISTEGECPDKEVAFLNKLTNLYIEKNLENKNIAHENTIKFIDKQLKETSDSLAFIEFQLQQFKKKNNVTNLSIESQYFYEELNEYNKERAELLIQNKYYDYLSDYLISTSDLSNIVVPVTYGVKDNILNSMIENLVNLQIEKNIRNQRNSLENPAINDISFQISDLKKAIIELISNQRKANQILLNDIASRKSLAKNSLNALPSVEIELVNIQRHYQLSESIYLFLLQKRAEAGISGASTISDIQVFEPARIENGILKFPNKANIYLFGLLLGIIIPLLIILLKNVLNDKVISRRDIERITAIPFWLYCQKSQWHRSNC